MNIQQIEQGDTKILFSDFYKYIEFLGAGTFAQVVKAQCLQTKDIVAVKIIQKKTFRGGDLSRLLKEAEILASLRHKNIVQFQKVQQTDTKVLIQMELVQGGQLRRLIYELNSSSMVENDKREIMKCIYSAIEYFHKMNIVHRDLKPGSNILVSDMRDPSSIKIIDFGLSSQQIQFLSGHSGTLIYMAPEQFNSKVYSKAVDIWSCAFILYMICSNGKHPLYEKDEMEDTYKAKLQNPKWDFPQDFPILAKHLFLKCVEMDPSQRYTASQILTHPWITGKINEELPLTAHDTMQVLSQRENLIRVVKTVLIIEIILKNLGKSKHLLPEYIQMCMQYSSDQENMGSHVELFEKQYFKDMMLNNQSIKFNFDIDNHKNQIADKIPQQGANNNDKQQKQKYQIYIDEILHKKSSLEKIQDNADIQHNQQFSEQDLQNSPLNQCLVSRNNKSVKKFKLSDKRKKKIELKNVLSSNIILICEPQHKRSISQVQNEKIQNPAGLSQDRKIKIDKPPRHTSLIKKFEQLDPVIDCNSEQIFSQRPFIQQQYKYVEKEEKKNTSRPTSAQYKYNLNQKKTEASDFKYVIPRQDRRQVNIKLQQQLIIPINDFNTFNFQENRHLQFDQDSLQRIHDMSLQLKTKPPLPSKTHKQIGRYSNFLK